MRYVWLFLPLAWIVVLCVVPVLRPLGAPEWAVRGVRSVAGVSEASARAAATFAFRCIGIGLIGVLLTLSLRRVPLRMAAPLVLVATPLFAVVAEWINFGC